MTTIANKFRNLAVLLGIAALAGCASSHGRNGQPEWESHVTQVGHQQRQRYDHDERQGRYDRHDRHERRAEQRHHQSQPSHHRFEERHRIMVRNYYAREFHGRGHCPPGLAKRHNGCTPPGHAKQWRIGHPLHQSVAYYDLPPALVLQIGAPPRGHRYVRVAGDLLLIAIGTAIVVDAIDDLSWR